MTSSAYVQGDPGPHRAKPSRRRQAIAGVVTLAVLAVVFAGIFPQFADYGEAWDAVQRLSAVAITALVLATLLNLYVYTWPFKAALPELTFGQTFTVRQTAYTISNVVPLGAAFSLGVEYQMLASYRVDPHRATAAVGITALWNILATLGLPIIAVVVFVFAGDSTSGGLAAAAAGLLVIVAIVIGLVLVVRSDGLARRLGHLAERAARLVLSRLGRDRELRLAESLSKFRASTHRLLQTRWLPITVWNLQAQVATFLVLYAAVVGLQGGDGGVGPAGTFGAFALARLGTFIPITPGGLGTVDGAMVALLSEFGATSPDAVAAVLIWRALTFLLPALVGIGTFLHWRATSTMAATDS